MLRDKHKNRAYFEKRLKRLQERLKRKVSKSKDIKKDYLEVHYQFLVLFNEELVNRGFERGDFSLLSRDSVLSQTHCLRGSSI